MTKKPSTEPEAGLDDGTPVDAAAEAPPEAETDEVNSGSGGAVAPENGADEAGVKAGDDAGGTADSELAVDTERRVDDVTELREELDALTDRHLRLAAEFNNFRRRQEAEAAGTWARAQADLLLRFLDVLDDLNRVSGLDPADEAVSVQSIVEGVDLVERKFIRALEDCGAEVIHAEGEPFNPEIMEGMMRVPADSEEQDETVAQVFQKGYMLKGTLVRPARVSVYKAG
ncbi:MAG TPA: nucleotide exchange factor GrpE [Longimicrobiales bacterium]|jgi:molecular chaperone GrpE